MRSFRPLFFLSILLLAQRSYAHKDPLARHRRLDDLSGTLDGKGKRDANAVFTWFDDGLGACGITNSGSDFIVALNAAEFAGGIHCFEMITITVNGKTTQAQITDECMGCAQGGLDFSRGLFQYFGSLSEGQLQGSWNYNSGTTTSSSTPPAPTTSGISTSTSVPATTGSSSSPSTSTSSTSSSASAATTVPTSTPQNPQMITEINLALLELGILLQTSFMRSG